MPTIKIGAAIMLVVATTAFAASGARADVMSLQQVISEVQTQNPQVRSAYHRWESATHQIIQNYTPVDPQFSYLDSDSPNFWLGGGSGLHTITVTQAFQFPGKGYLQGSTAKRTAEIARLMYLAAVRDVKAQAQTGYYELQLDLALFDLITEDVANLERVQKVTQIQYAASMVTQGDYINGQFALEADRETLRQQRVTIENDKTALNILLNRRPDEPLEVERKLDLATFEISLDQIVARAIASRQEILQAALTQQNQDTALTLARLEYAPDYSLGFAFDHWLIPSFAPAVNHTEDYNFTIAFNVPIFYWAKNEDISKANQDLEAAKEDLASVRIQTAGQVTTLYRQILRSRETALLYRDTLIPLAHQAFEVMLVAYQNGKVDFTTLISAFRQESASRTTYLQSVNSLLAGKVAIEQAAGGNLQ